MADWTEEVTQVAGTNLAIIKGGTGKPILVLHEELGYSGWMSWHAALAKDRTLMIPIQPGLGKSPKIDWIRNIHDLALFYSWVVREMNLAPLDVIGSSVGGWIAAEMATINPQQFRKMVLGAPAGTKPPEGEIADVFSITAHTSLNLSVLDRETPEFKKLYGGERTPAQLEAIEHARTENARTPFDAIINNPALARLLVGVTGLPPQLGVALTAAVGPVSASQDSG